MTYVFIDTNIFIHFQDVEQIDWNALLHSKDSVTITIAPIVITELDKHKYSSNKKVSKRVKKILPKLEGYIHGSETPKHLFKWINKHPESETFQKNGLYDVRYTDRSIDCITRIIGGVALSAGNITVQDVIITCFPPSGINDLNEPFLFTAQPNVFTNNTQVFFNSSSEVNSLITLFDATGKMLKQFHIETTAAHITLGSELANGVYYLKAEQGNTSKALRVVKAN